MSKSFVERLTRAQVEEFLEQEYPYAKGYHWKFTKRTPNDNTADLDYVWVFVTREFTDFDEVIRLEDYDTRGNISRQAWLKFLHREFGQEYYEAYRDHVMQVLE